MFAERAGAADAHFEITREDEAALSEICRHLGGIPLAIELAATRVTALPLHALAKELGYSFQALTRGERTAPLRQQTMRAAIEWSYDLLSGPEQRVFERLSVFAGGCTIDAAKAVCRDDDVAADEVPPLIVSLLNKSLLLADLNANEPRYRLLEPFREY